MQQFSQGISGRVSIRIISSIRSYGSGIVLSVVVYQYLAKKVAQYDYEALLR